MPFAHPKIYTTPEGELWFKETSELWPGEARTLRVKKVLHNEQSKYQDVLYFESTDYGNVFVLDGVIQCTERDEFAYQEMIAHLPLFAHKNPKNVLVIGGGDAGVLREVVKHKSVEKVTLCEIDEAVIRTAKQYLPEMAKGFDNEKVEVFVGDGFEYLKNHVNCFDVIITDSSDPIGPAASLFQPEFFSLLKNALKPSGIICSQGESQWLHLEIIAGLVKKTSKLFPVVEYAYTTIPTYPSGQIGFLICSNDETVDVKKVNSDGLTEDQMNELKYYTKELHQASFVLPAFTRRSIEASKNAE